MEQRKSMIEMQWQITEDGKLIKFSDYLDDTIQDGISIHYMADQLQETLEAASSPDAQWTDAIDYIAPIAGHILCEAVEVDRELYNELVISLKDAYVRLREKSQEERAADKVFELDRDNVDFIDDLDNLIQTLAGGGCSIKSVNSAGKGQYSITVSETE
ncbi:hypothetical protein [Paenibacillus odorifer]|uniref:Uncharacterized protein n=1 Tax=Paenibacillus odorifer TaxID=189426 RepID=A0A1R0Y5E4_9BACL|nr:hypothetical protein [Paenibacillus odorifer]OMD42568.1 hypothetical protein BSK52_07095 [Paenibacillus odorifer]